MSDAEGNGDTAAVLTTTAVTVTTMTGQTHTVTILNPDLIRWELTRERQQWPTAQAAPQLWLTYVTWAALTRTRELDGEPWEAFRDRVRQLDAVEVPADPTRPAAAPASPSSWPG